VILKCIGENKVQNSTAQLSQDCAQLCTKAGLAPVTGGSPGDVLCAAVTKTGKEWYFGRWRGRPACLVGGGGCLIQGTA